MDALQRVEPAARGLLVRVDAALIAHGAPDGHPLWPLLRRAAVPPGEAVAFFAGVDPAPLRAAAGDLRGLAQRYAETSVPTQPAWQGSAGAAYTAAAEALAAHLGAGDDPDSMGGRLAATASYVEEVADWYAKTRAAIAVALVEVLGCAQAVAVGTGPDLSAGAAELARPADVAVPPALAAAADIGAHVLAPVVAALELGRELADRWAQRLAELSLPAPPVGAIGFGPGIELRL
ncbi:MAG: hypothetical protein ACM30G_04565 [Micromonosporaceae bacterium]